MAHPVIHLATADQQDHGLPQSLDPAPTRAEKNTPQAENRD